MAMTGKDRGKSFKFTYPAQVEVHRLKLEPLASLKSLDFTRLRKGSHKIEVGFVSGGCCRKLVRAAVRNGMVTALEVESCKAGRPLSPQLAAIAKAVQRRVRARRRKWQPVPIDEFVKQPQNVADDNGCFHFCWFNICVYCCNGHCSLEDIYTGPLSNRL